MAENSYDDHKDRLLANEVPPPEVKVIGEKVDQLVTDVAVLKVEFKNQSEDVSAIKRLLEGD